MRTSAIFSGASRAPAAYHPLAASHLLALFLLSGFFLLSLFFLVAPHLLLEKSCAEAGVRMSQDSRAAA